MPVKMSGAEFKRFMNSDWGPDAMWEEQVIIVNGEPLPDNEHDPSEIVNDKDVVTIESGTIFPDQRILNGPCFDAVRFARKWLKDQSTTSFVVEGDKDQVEAIKALLRERFGKAVKIAA